MKPFVKSRKNDYVDAEAIPEAVQRPTMRFVPIKTEDQLDLQALHRVRDRLVDRRTGVINQLRAFLLERGMVIRTGRMYLQKMLPSLGARAVMARTNRERHRFCDWVSKLETRAHRNVVGVALANKLARIAWAVLNREAVYDGTIWQPCSSRLLKSR